MDDCGQGLAEYALILALASLGVVLAVLILQDSIGTTFQGAGARIEAPSSHGSPPDGGSNGNGNPQGK